MCKLQGSSLTWNQPTCGDNGTDHHQKAWKFFTRAPEWNIAEVSGMSAQVSVLRGGSSVGAEEVPTTRKLRWRTENRIRDALPAV